MKTKQKRFEMRLSSEDFETLSNQAKRCRITKTHVMYSAWKELIIKEAPHPDYYEIIIQLRRIGSNINQLLKLANAKGLIITGELRKALEENRKVEKALWKAVTPEKKKVRYKTNGKRKWTIVNKVDK